LSPSQPVWKERQAQVLYWKQVQDNIATTLDSIKKNFLFDRDTPDSTGLDSALVFLVAKKKDIAQYIYDIKMARSTWVSSPMQTEAEEGSLVIEGLLELDSTDNRMKGLVGILAQLVRGYESVSGDVVYLERVIGSQRVELAITDVDSGSVSMHPFRR